MLKRRRIVEPDVPHKKMKEYIIRLVYIEMLGHDASFGYIQAVEMTHDDNLLLKQSGYLAVTLFLNEDHNLIILIVNTIQKDLKSDNYLVCCAALTAVCKLLNEETIPGVLPQVVELLTHPKELVRKKAVMALHRFHQFYVTRTRVMSAAVCVLFDLMTADAQVYKNFTTSFMSIQKQIKILKILALLGAGDKHTSENMYSVLAEILKRSDGNSNIGNAILYECICTITTIHVSPRLLEVATEITSRFVKSENHNYKYMGIDALGCIIKLNPDFAEKHQLAVIDCLEACYYQIDVRQNYKISDGKESPLVAEVAEEREQPARWSDAKPPKEGQNQQPEGQSDDANRMPTPRFPWDSRDSSRKMRSDLVPHKKPKMDIELIARAKVKTAEDPA
ncbi:unnamed protein product [Sphagnum balticum]